MTDLDIDIVDMVDYEMSLALVGDMVSDLSRGTAFRSKLSNLRIKITDHSLNKRIEKYYAELGLTPAQILAAHLEAINDFGKRNGIVFNKYLLDPYKQYLAGNPVLVVTEKPGEPVDFTEIEYYNSIDVPALLNLEAVAQ